ncbi:aryl-alcohol dehydrogenase-like predicted oxidoreductase [Catenulispora sp. MAP5-51]
MYRAESNRITAGGLHRPVLTTLSYGTAALGNLYSPIDDESAPAAVSAGIRSFDTAPH